MITTGINKSITQRYEKRPSHPKNSAHDSPHDPLPRLALPTTQKTREGNIQHADNARSFSISISFLPKIEPLLQTEREANAIANHQGNHPPRTAESYASTRRYQSPRSQPKQAPPRTQRQRKRPFIQKVHDYFFALQLRHHFVPHRITRLCSFFVLPRREDLPCQI